MKLKSGFSAYFANQPGNGSNLFYSSWGLDTGTKDLWLPCTDQAVSTRWLLPACSEDVWSNQQNSVGLGRAARNRETWDTEEQQRSQEEDSSNPSEPVHARHQLSDRERSAAQRHFLHQMTQSWSLLMTVNVNNITDSLTLEIARTPLKSPLTWVLLN